MGNKETIEVLNSLITINNDRIQGYQKAVKQTEEPDVKTIFGELSKTSQYCNKELSAEVTKLGGTPAKGTTTSGKVYRVWMDIQSALTGKDRDIILNACEYGEDVAKDRYEEVLMEQSEHLSAELQVMVKAQHVMLKADHDKVKQSRDILVG